MIPRLIPALTIVNEKLVRTRMFNKPSYVGDPINAVKIFNEKGADELIVFDIGKAKNFSTPGGLTILRNIADRAFMPLAYGGGITDLSHARTVIEVGYDKIVVSSLQLARHGVRLVEELARVYGSQSVAVALDVGRTFYGKESVRGFTWHVSSSRITELAISYVNAGAGEIIVRDISRCGMGQGPNLGLLKAVSASVEVPVVCAGGVRDLEDVKSALDAGAQSVSASNFFVYHGPRSAVLITYPDRKDLDAVLGVNV